MPLVPEKGRLGEILVKRGVLTEEALERALTAQGRSLLPLASTVLELGIAGEVQVAEALAEQYGVPAVRLSACVIDTTLLATIPREVAASHRVLPAGVSGGALTLVLANPKDQPLIDEISFACGRPTLPMVAVRAQLEQAIRAAYDARARGEAVWRGPEATAEGPHLEIVQAPPLTPRAHAAVIEPELSTGALESFPAPPPPGPRVQRERPLVLAVDDEPEILDLIEKALTRRGMDVVRAARGREALELLRSTVPDIVLLDAMLPEIHGFEICSQIKGSAQYQHIPVVIISAIYTGWNFIEDVKRIYKADDYITKPFRVMELVHRVEEILAKEKGRPRSPELALAHKEAAQELRIAAEAFRLGQIEAAVEAAQRAIAADPFDARAHFMLGTALHRVGRLYEAISEYERVVELAPGQFNALKNLAVLYERQGFRAKAVEMWTRALHQSPSEPVRQTIKAHLIGLL